MTQYRVLASEGRQRYIYTKTHKNIKEKKIILKRPTDKRRTLENRKLSSSPTLGLFYAAGDYCTSDKILMIFSL
jgi:hypothetical protein